MKLNEGGPAFPAMGEQGLYVLEYFAAHAPIPWDASRTMEQWAKLRYEYARAMVDERLRIVKLVK